MISYAIEAAKNSTLITDVYVNSDSDEIGEVSKALGVKFYKRPKHLASDTASSDDYNYDFFQSIQPDLLVQVNPVNPLIMGNDIDNIIQYFLDKDIAECLYTGILTDTGSFKFPSTSSKVHRIVADLIDKGVDSSNVNGLIYDTNSLNRLKLIGFSLSKKLKLIGNNKAAFIVLTKDDLLKFKFEKGDTEGLVNYALSIMGVNMATLIVETRDKIKFSFRSIGNFSVNDFAKQNFNGGGHKNAAGGSLEDKLSVALKKFLIAISKNEKLLNY